MSKLCVADCSSYVQQHTATALAPSLNHRSVWLRGCVQSSTSSHEPHVYTQHTTKGINMSKSVGS